MTQEVLNVTNLGDQLEIHLTDTGDLYIGEPHDPESTYTFSMTISRTDWEGIKRFVDRQFSTINP